SAAFTLGLLLGLDPLVLVGQDQAFDHGRVHAAGTPGDEPIRTRAALFTVTGLDGRELETHSAFAAALHWYAEAVRYLRQRDPGRTVLNANESGAAIPGLPAVALKEVIGRLPAPGPKPDLAALLAGSPRPEAEAVRDILTRTLMVAGRLRELWRRAPQAAAQAAADSRSVHPFLDEALGAFELVEESADPGAVLGEIEVLLLKMLEALD
ncbi:MAG: hypothetical protein AB1896_17320, partial [Thermodesulfobacteriota bacterium]